MGSTNLPKPFLVRRTKMYTHYRTFPAIQWAVLLYCRPHLHYLRRYKRKMYCDCEYVYLSTSSSSAGATYSRKSSHENIRILISFRTEEKKLYTASFYTVRQYVVLSPGSHFLHKNIHKSVEKILIYKISSRGIAMLRSTYECLFRFKNV